MYSFGVVLWEMEKLDIPWKDMHPNQVIAAVAFKGKRLPIPEQASPVIQDIITKCWKEQDTRYGRLSMRLTENISNDRL